jgi:hypothetical protein
LRQRPGFERKAAGATSGATFAKNAQAQLPGAPEGNGKIGKLLSTRSGLASRVLRFRSTSGQCISNISLIRILEPTTAPAKLGWVLQGVVERHDDGKERLRLPLRKRKNRVARRTHRSEPNHLSR